uniref:HDC03637 n=1 Tax=Drosophila melanogaster TaxID=7227 RepID=Q6IH18_DROME|nr:TPA_inf: HDC03637 [Drosophila melanogaster]
MVMPDNWQIQMHLTLRLTSLSTGNGSLLLGLKRRSERKIKPVTHSHDHQKRRHATFVISFPILELRTSATLYGSSANASVVNLISFRRVSRNQIVSSHVPRLHLGLFSCTNPHALSAKALILK